MKFTLFEKLVLLLLLKHWNPRYDWDCYLNTRIQEMIGFRADYKQMVDGWIKEEEERVKCSTES